MANGRGIVTISGITQTLRNNAIPGMDRKSNDFLFSSGVIGVSVTSWSVGGGGPSWAVEVYSDIGGFETIVAGVSGIGSTTSVLVPIRDANGSTQSNFIGIPYPTSVDIVGSSTSVGATFSCIVAMAFHN